MAEPSKTSGNWNSVAGTVKETLGHLTGATELEKSGHDQHAKGEAEIKAAQAKQYTEGLGNQVQGKVDNVIGAVTGDDTKQAAGRAQEEQGKLQKDLA